MPTIEYIDENGFGIVTRDEGKPYAVPDTLPGEEVTIQKTKRRKKMHLAKTFERHSSSPSRIKSPCPYFGQCGGCRLQHMPYHEQLTYKKRMVERYLEPLEADVVVEDIVASPQEYGYKNRLDIAVTTKGIGFREFGLWWKVVDIEHCLLFSDRCRQALAELRKAMDDYKLVPWNLHDHVGDIRYITLREGKNTGEFMIVIVSSREKPPEGIENYFTCDSLYWLQNDTPSDVAGGTIIRYWHRPSITETLNGISFEIHPQTFFQTNTVQAEQLIAYTASCVREKRVLDLYCGVGTIALHLADKHDVTGMEMNPQSIEQAHENAKVNELGAQFIVQSDDKVMDLTSYDAFVVDPPRAGLHPKFVERCIRNGPLEIVYVSCNPKSLATDLARLTEVYDVESIRCFDMFPQTPHIETVVVLKRKRISP